MTADRVGGAALLGLALFVAWESRRLPLGTHHGPGPGYFPRRVGRVESGGPC